MQIYEDAYTIATLLVAFSFDESFVAVLQYLRIQALCEQRYNRSLKEKDAFISNLEETVSNLQCEIKRVSKIYYVVMIL